MQERVAHLARRQPHELNPPRLEPISFSEGRHRAIDRLVAAGISRDLATEWIATWDRSTADLADFRRSSDFWHQGFRYALEEYRRGYRPVLD